MADKRRINPDPLTYERQGDSTVLRPQAQAIDTFTRPAPALPSELNDLAATLSQINPKLQAFAVRKTEELRAEDIQKAERSAMASTAVTMQEAIDKGEIQPGQSPLFQRVFEETTAKREAITTAPMTLYQAWVSPDNPDRNSTDPKVINEFFNKQTTKMLEGKSEEYKAGFVPQLLAARQQLSNKITAENAAEVEEKLAGELGQIMFDRIKNAGGQSPAAIAAAIAEDTIPARFAGLKGTKANGIIAQAIVAAAQTSGNSALLKVGYEPRPDLKNPGQMIPGVFTTPKYAVMADNAATSILSKQNAQAARAAAAEARSDKARVKEFFPMLLKYRRENPDDPNVPAELLDKAAELAIPPTAVQSNWVASGKIAPPMPYNVRIGKLAELARISNEGGDVAGYLARTPGLVSDEKAFTLLSEGGLKQAHSTDMYQVQARAIDGMLDSYMKKFDPQTGSDIVRQAKSELSGRVSDLYLSLSRADPNGHVDPKKLEDGIHNLGTEITTRMRAAEDAKDKADTPKATPSAAPAKGGKEASAAPAGNANRLSAVTSGVDTNGNENPWASSRGFTPTGSPTDTWSPPDSAEPPSLAQINALRENPYRTGKAGTPIWQAFEQEYGPGAADFFIRKGERDIRLILQGWSQKRERNAPAKAPAATGTPTNPNAQ